MSNIAPLRRPINQELVDLLQSVLDQAQSGEVTGVLMLVQHPDEQRTNYNIVGVQNRMEKLGLLYYALHNLCEVD